MISYFIFMDYFYVFVLLDYLTEDLRPRQSFSKGFYYGVGEDDHGVQFSTQYQKIFEKYVKELFIPRNKQILNFKASPTYKKLYRIVLSEVFLQQKRKPEPDKRVFYVYNVYNSQNELLSV